LLTTALRRKGQCAIGRWVSRGKEHLVVIRPLEEGLAMHQLHFRAEVRDIKDLGLETTEVKEAELKLAEQLIDHLAAKTFDPNEYHDEFKGRVDAAIQRKVAGKEVSLAEPPVAKVGGNVVDLMAALKASLDARSSRPSVRERKAPKQAPHSGARRAVRQ
jgi:DNA end-binding protein Ku